MLKVTTTHNLEMYKIQQKVQFKNKHIQCFHDSTLHYEVNFSTILNHLLKNDDILKPRPEKKSEIVHLATLGYWKAKQNLIAMSVNF